MSILRSGCQTWPLTADLLDILTISLNAGDYVLLIAGIAALVACRKEEPQLLSWSVTPAGENVPLSYAAEINSVSAGLATVRWSADDHGGSAEFEVEAGKTTRLPLLGFRQDRSYELTIVFRGSSGEPEDGEVLALKTPVVSTINPVELVMADPARMSGGLTVLPLWGGGIDARQAVVVDAEGEIVYLLEMDDRFHELRRRGDGLLALVGNEELEIREVSWLGERGRTFLSAGAMVEGREGTIVDLPGRIHHDVVPLDDDGYIIIATGLRTVDLPSSYDTLDDLVPTQIEDDVIVRFDAQGAVVWSQELSPMLDEHRIGFDSLSRPRLPDAVEWGHTNAIWMEEDGRIGLSVRHQDEIVMFDPTDGQVDWILGNDSNRDPVLAEPLLTPVGAFTYPYHPHGARRTGNVLSLFDNGNWRASPGEIPFDELPEPTEMYSRLVEYEIDEVAMTFRELRSFDLSASVGPVFSVALGDMDVLPNGNVLGTFGRILARDGVLTEDLGFGAGESRIVEFSPEGDEVWHLRLSIDGLVEPVGWATWRAERFDAFPYQGG